MNGITRNQRSVKELVELSLDLPCPMELSGLLAKDILTCGPFDTVSQIEDCERVARALNNYIILTATFPSRYSYRREVEAFINLKTRFAQETGLVERLNQLKVRGDPSMSNSDKLEMLLKMRLNILSMIEERKKLESARVQLLSIQTFPARVQAFPASENHLSSDVSFCAKALTAVFVLASFFLIILAAAAGNSVDL